MHCPLSSQNRAGSALARGERHSDQRRAAEQQIDADQQAYRPFRRTRKPGDDHGGNQDVQDASEHQKPGICRAQNVSASPATPLIRNIQPRKMVTARLASGGRIMAARPNTTSRMPSNKKAFQCSRTAALTSDCSLLMSWGTVIGKSPDTGIAEPQYSLRQRRAVKFVHIVQAKRFCPSLGRARTKSPGTSCASDCDREYRSPW